MHTQPLPGFRDFYPAEFAFRAHIFDTWRQVCRRYGFEEFDGPPLEPLELYTAKSGDEIVGQLYHFTDKGGREVSLRPELTPTLARMVAARAGGMKKPIRWYLDRPDVPLRAAAAGPAAGVLPAQLRPHRRTRPAGRRRADRPGGRT